MATLRVPGSLESLDDIRSFIKEEAQQAGLDDRQIYRLSLAVDEIATNIVTYGYVGSGTDGDIVVHADGAQDGLRIVLQDNSPAFDPFSKAVPDDLDAPLEERNIGGLGIFLASQNVDEFRYEYEDGHNRNIFVMNTSVEEAT